VLNLSLGDAGGACKLDGDTNLPLDPRRGVVARPRGGDSRVKCCRNSLGDVTVSGYGGGGG
jgi:hypothetical protein